MDLSIAAAFFGGAIFGLTSKYLLSKDAYIKKRFTESETSSSININKKKVNIEKHVAMFLMSDEPKCKVVVGVRTDMNLLLSETASLLGDVVIKTVVKSISNKSKYVGFWLESGQTKICAKVQSKEMMEDLVKKAVEANVVHETITYKGQTAAFVAGPEPIEIVDSVTNHLKLL